MDQTEPNAQLADAESIADVKVEDSSSNVAAETGHQTSGALAQLTASYREINDGDNSSDDTER